MIKVVSLTDIASVRDYLNRVGAEPRSLKTAVVKEHRGKYWTDVAVIRFGSNGAIDCSSMEHGPTETEQALIMAEWTTVQFPTIKLLTEIFDPPEMMRNAPPQNIFEFRDISGQHILMVQVRQDSPTGKAYVPWTYWDDNRWRSAEPDGELPLWGLDQLRAHKTVFIHEGAKAARYCRWIAEGATPEAQRARAAHPWGAEMVGAAHVGWIGGALSPRRTDWSALSSAGIERAYIVADNDVPGKRAVSSISQALRVPTFSIEFNGRFKPSFDLADPFPKEMFQDIAGQQFYCGPSLRELTQPATWATDQLPNPAGTGRPTTVLRESFGQMWAYVEEADAFICTEMPEILRSESVFNKIVSAFSHVAETSRLLCKAYKGRSARLCYRPDQSARLIDHRGANAINLHVPGNIKASAGDPAPWLEFLNYLFINEGERKHVERWAATIIAHPETRIGFGLLLISEMQGVGKTTLGSVVLAPLVGTHNVGYPSENDITSPFNDWVAHKRLAIVNEIYSGSSWKAYHSLKSTITDAEVMVNQKYMRQYVVDNWCHILACSNSTRALKMEMDDRRWFYPEVTEAPWPGSKFSDFRRWCASGGLSIIKAWAEAYGDYVHPSERAPMTERKREMIEGSRSEAQRAVASLAEQALERGGKIALGTKDVVGWARSGVQGRIFESDYELRKTMVECGLRAWPKRIKVGGWLQHAVMTEELFDACQRTEDPGALIREHLLKAGDLAPAEM